MFDVRVGFRNGVKLWAREPTIITTDITKAFKTSRPQMFTSDAANQS